MPHSAARIVIIGGAAETSFHPIPPVADGAPEWNVFRLVEAVGDRLDITVLSPCEEGQAEAVRKFPASGKYEQIYFSEKSLRIFRHKICRSLPVQVAVRRLAKLPDFFSWVYLRQVVKQIRRIQPDLVLINARPQYIRYLRGQLGKMKIWMFLRGTMGESSRYLHLLDGMIVNSEGMRRYAKSLLPDGYSMIRKIPNALGNEFDVPEDASKRYQNQSVVFVGRLIADKGTAELIRAFQIVREQLPEAVLTIYGASGNQPDTGEASPYQKQLRELAGQLPEGAVRFGGYIPNAELGPVYTRANLAVFPSLCNESFGMVALEAMRCRTAVVASRRAGFEELVTPGETGLIVDDPRNIESLAEAILTVLRDPDLAQRMGMAGGRRSAAYTPEKAAEQFCDVIEEVMGQPPMKMGLA